MFLILIYLAISKYVSFTNECYNLRKTSREHLKTARLQIAQGLKTDVLL
jgi:hypothetical protein